MRTIKVEEIDYQMPTGWDELNWQGYIGILKLEATRENQLVDFMYTQRFIEIICGVGEGQFDEMEIDELADLEQIIRTGLNPDLLKNISATTDHFVINGLTYSFYSPNTINKMKIGEAGFIDTLKLHSKEPYDYILKQLAVLIRPATKTVNSEGLEKWKLDKFDKEDLEHRTKILQDNLKVKDLVMVNNFFLSMTKK